MQESFGTTRAKVNTKLERVLPSKSDLVTIFPTLIRSSLIGTLIGAIPGTGGDIASWVGYNLSLIHIWPQRAGRTGCS